MLSLYICEKLLFNSPLHQQPAPKELEKEVAGGKEAVEEKESGEGSSSKQDTDFKDFDSGNTQMFMEFLLKQVI